MQPALLDGDHVLVDPGPGPWQRGVLVWVRDPRNPDNRMVKRIDRVLADGRLVLRGDNPARSTDSRHFGPVQPALILGRVVWRFPR